ncbi:uncharacterized protein LOC125237697 [Leguminivora glycinivorella]|uniref:uncharacterized protein LOC125237697 n=1 Tax=Leguminivora glycinivorella TaxID=1035111 RepID=UPI00200D5861|nr:uncharacterized protein LOC125237697 [Leguminivora glycinivorella]
MGKSRTQITHLEATFMRVTTTMWNVKNLLLLMVLSIACENFYKTIKIAENRCANILSEDRACGMRKTCKNVLRLNRASLRKMSAFGVFQLDAAFPLRLLGGLVAYIVVLLQFAFLSS